MSERKIVPCPRCGGEGEWEESKPLPDDPDYHIQCQCDECNGCGWVYAEEVEPAAITSGKGTD